MSTQANRNPHPLFAVVDLETTGGNPQKTRIIEIAIVVHNGRQVIEEFSSLVNPGESIPPFIQGMTGISNEMVAEAPTFAGIHDKVLKLTENKIFVAHNVRFDYGVLRNEYKRMNMRFQRQQLCTVRLSRKLYPELTSHSLGNLCRDLAVPVVNRHRAYGDAHATTLLLEYMLFNNRKEVDKHMVKDEMENTVLPHCISRKQIDELPEETGVYYFFDEMGKILYVGKSRNIRKRFVNHFSGDLQKKRFAQLKEHVADLNYEITGNELIALLRESADIKHWMPPFNKAQRKKKYRYGIYVEKNEDCYEIKLRKINGEGEPLRQFTNRNAAVQFLQRMVERHNLRPDFCDLQQNQWPDLPSMPTELEHNEGVALLQASMQHPYETFIVVEDGRNYGEQAFVMVEENRLSGYAFLDEDAVPDTPAELREYLWPLPDDQEMHQILRKWISKKKPKVVPFEV